MAETRICETCHLAHPPAQIPDELTDVAEKRLLEVHACALAQAGAMLWLLEHVGKKGVCDGPNCHAVIYWVTHTNGRKTPYTMAGLNHFVDCPDRDRFARKAAK
jgi:hypothetical protein